MTSVKVAGTAGSTAKIFIHSLVWSFLYLDAGASRGKGAFFDKTNITRTSILSSSLAAGSNRLWATNGKTLCPHIAQTSCETVRRLGRTSTYAALLHLRKFLWCLLWWSHFSRSHHSSSSLSLSLLISDASELLSTSLRSQR